MSRTLQFDVGETVHALVKQTRDKLVNGMLQISRDQASGAELIAQEEYTAFEADGSISRIAVTLEGDQSRVEYLINYPEADGSIGRRWVNEKFLAAK